MATVNIEHEFHLQNFKKLSKINKCQENYRLTKTSEETEYLIRLYVWKHQKTKFSLQQTLHT